MNLDWILNPLTMYGALGICGAGCLYMVFSARIEIARYAQAHAAEKKRLEQSVAGLSARLDELAAEPVRTAAPAAEPVSLGQHRRAEALRLYRRGSDPHTIAAAVGISRAEAALLEKVHHILVGDGAQ